VLTQTTTAHQMIDAIPVMDNQSISIHMISPLEYLNSYAET